jgi:hypothetical protein
VTRRAHSRLRPARRGPWPLGALIAVALGVAVLALPARFEGPPLVPVSPGHALSLVDGLGVVPLVAGAAWLHAGLWRRRARLARWAGDRPGAGAAASFAAGLGLGLLAASAFSSFVGWWAVGAVVFAGANAAAIAVAARDARGPVSGTGERTPSRDA